MNWIVQLFLTRFLISMNVEIHRNGKYFEIETCKLRI